MSLTLKNQNMFESKPVVFLSGPMISFNNIKTLWSQPTNPGLLLTWHGHPWS